MRAIWMLAPLILGCRADKEPADPTDTDAPTTSDSVTTDTDTDTRVETSLPTADSATPPAVYREVSCLDGMGVEAPGMVCAYVSMPQNRVRETGRDIDLFLVRPADPPVTSALPLVVLAGGPGAPHCPFAGDKGLPITLSELLGREVIYVEQRGLAPGLPDTACDLDGASDEAAVFAACRAELESDLVDVHSFHTLENAADIGELAGALGVPQIDVFAGSYATRLVGKALTHHGDGIRAAVMGGVDVPGATDLSLPARFEGVLTAAGDDFAARCVADPACDAYLPGFDLAAELDRIDVLAARDGSVSIAGIPFGNASQVRDAFHQMMYLAQVRNLFFAATYHAARESSPLFHQHIGEGDEAAGEVYVVELFEAAAQAVYGGSSVMSTVTRCYDGQAAACAVMGDRIDDYPPEQFTSPTGADHPVLMLSGTFDPATPAANVDGFLPLFTSGQESEFSCLGHDVSRVSNLANGTCLAEQVVSFLDDPTAPLPDCAAAMCDGVPLAPTRTDIDALLDAYL